MNTFVLIQKDYLEFIRNKKFLALILIFAFSGFISPISAYYIPEIMAQFAEKQNITIEFPTPTYTDAIVQYIKNISQMCVFILILITMGLITNEKDKGTAVFLLVKPVRRNEFILSKFFTLFSITLLALTTGGLCAILYTFVFFDAMPIYIFIQQNILLLLYITTILSITFMYGTICKSQIIAGILSFFTWLSFTLFGQFGDIGKYSPDHLLKQASALITNINIQYHSIIMAVFIIILTLSISLISFAKWEPR